MSTSKARLGVAAVAAASLALVLLRRRRLRAEPAATDEPGPSRDAGPHEVPRATTFAEVAVLVREHGVCVLESVLSKAAIAELRERCADLAPASSHPHACAQYRARRARAHPHATSTYTPAALMIPLLAVFDRRPRQRRT